MTDADGRIEAALETLTPSLSDERGDWTAVVADASRQPVRRWRGVVAGGATIAAAILAVLAWPDSGMSPGRVLERAAAAAGTGPVFHAVFEADSPGTLLDLRTGERRRLRAQRELWYHPERGLRTVLRVAGRASGVTVQTADEVGGNERRLYEMFTTNYREALAGGLAEVVEDGEIDGRGVYWLQISAEAVPATRDHSSLQMRELADVVAVDRETFKPLYVRRTLNGKALGRGFRILHTSSVPAQAVRIAPNRLSAEGMGYGESLRRDLDLPEARRRMETPALWVGDELQEVPLGRIVELDFEEGRGGFENWTITPGLALVYGRMTRTGHPDPRAEYVWLRQSPRRIASMSVYVPPEGTAFVGGRGAFLVKQGTHVSIEASSEELALAAARALRPIGS